MSRTDRPEGVSEVAGAAGGREAFGGRLLARGQLLAQPATAVLTRLPLSSRSAHLPVQGALNQTSKSF